MVRNLDCAQHSLVNVRVRRSKIARAEPNARQSPAETKASLFAAPRKSLDMKVIFHLGRGYLGRKKTLVTLYIFGYFLCQTSIPLGVSLTAGSLTEYFKATFAPPEVHTTCE
jgi:hypothetical protein